MTVDEMTWWAISQILFKFCDFLFDFCWFYPSPMEKKWIWIKENCEKCRLSLQIYFSIQKANIQIGNVSTCNLPPSLVGVAGGLPPPPTPLRVPPLMLRSGMHVAPRLPSSHASPHRSRSTYHVGVASESAGPTQTAVLQACCALLTSVVVGSSASKKRRSYFAKCLQAEFADVSTD